MRLTYEDRVIQALFMMLRNKNRKVIIVAETKNKAKKFMRDVKKKIKELELI